MGRVTLLTALKNCVALPFQFPVDFLKMDKTRNTEDLGGPQAPLSEGRLLVWVNQGYFSLTKGCFRQKCEALDPITFFPIPIHAK